MEKENEKIAASRLNDKIAMRLKERRQKLGLSQGKLAEICGWTQSRIGNYEAGSRNVGVHDAVVWERRWAYLLLSSSLGKKTLLNCG